MKFLESQLIKTIRNCGLVLFAILVTIVFMNVKTYAASVEYTYDSLNRLVKTIYSDGIKTVTVEYEYDDAGNMTKYIPPPDTDEDGIIDAIEETTCTNPNDEDTDNDLIPDGIEDANKDGSIDPGETDPCDADTDDDGVLDGWEDKDHDGILDSGETDPLNYDSDSDGIQDGTELGYTMDNIGPDTDVGVFQPDLDPETTTDPLDADTDNDGLEDGEEDKNMNGRVDPEETDPNDFNPRYLPFIPLLLGD